MSDDVPTIDQVPATVRQRVVAIAAEVLPAVTQLPAALNRVAAFAPTRRARAGERAIVAALADDDQRARIGVQAEAHLRGSGVRPEDLVEAAARSWLLRPEGWEQAYADTLAGLETRTQDGARASGELERLRSKVERAEQDVRDLRAAHRVALDEQKAEISRLRRTVGEARAAERDARSGVDAALQESESARAELSTQVQAQEKELRRLRNQVAQSEAEAGDARRADRAEREDTSLRARMLLDTVLEATAGLQRELALPPLSGNPADRVEATLTDVGSRDLSSAGSLGSSSPALLEQYLAMPRARLVIDGYNVTKSAWPASSLEAQRIRLVAALAPVVARTGAETTVVFDAAAATGRGVGVVPRGVKVFFSPENVIADDVIRDLVAAEPAGRVVVVVTSDREVVADVVRDGAKAVTSTALIALLARP